jgi:hypothetical protein
MMGDPMLQRVLVVCGYLLVVPATGRAGEQGNRQRRHPPSRQGTCSPTMAGLENGTADACFAGLCGLGAPPAGDPERLHLCTGRRNGGHSLVKKQHHVHRNIAVGVIQLRSEAALPAAPCDRPRIGLFAKGGIVRDSARQGDSLYVFSQESIGDNVVLKQLLSHEWVIAAPHL